MSFIPTRSVHVFLWRDQDRCLVGQLACKDRRIFFEYDTDFLKKNIDSAQSYLRLIIDSFSIEFLKKSIDSGQSYLRLRIIPFDR